MNRGQQRRVGANQKRPLPPEQGMLRVRAGPDPSVREVHRLGPQLRGQHFMFARSTSQAPTTVRGQLIPKAERTSPSEAIRNATHLRR